MSEAPGTSEEGVTQAPRDRRLGGVLHCGHWAYVQPGKCEYIASLGVAARGDQYELCPTCGYLRTIRKCNVYEQLRAPLSRASVSTGPKESES